MTAPSPPLTPHMAAERARQQQYAETASRLAQPAVEVSSKALAILRDGRFRPLTVRTTPNGRVDVVDAIVYGHRGEHIVQFGMTGDMRTWVCSCPEGRAAQVCPHVFAAELVTHAITPPGTDRQPKGRPVKARGRR